MIFGSAHHERCGAQTPMKNLPPYVVLQILSYVMLKEDTSMYCGKCIAANKHETHLVNVKKGLSDMEDAYKILREKCAKCRGYDDDTPCVQIDCPTMFKKALQTKAINEIKSKLF